MTEHLRVCNRYEEGSFHKEIYVCYSAKNEVAQNDLHLAGLCKLTPLQAEVFPIERIIIYLNFNGTIYIKTTFIYIRETLVTKINKNESTILFYRFPLTTTLFYTTAVMTIH